MTDCGRHENQLNRRAFAATLGWVADCSGLSAQRAMNMGRAAAEVWREEIPTGVAPAGPLFGIKESREPAGTDRWP